MKDLEIKQGKTFKLVIRWETEPIIYRPITGIEQSAPVRLSVPLHGLPNGWRAAVTGVKGMTEINAEANNLKDKDYRPASVVNAGVIEFNDINAEGFKPYVSGGHVQFKSPVSLTGMTARMKVKDKVGGVTLLTLTSADGIQIDITNYTITLVISAELTEAMAWSKGVYDLEMIDVDGVVTGLLNGKVTVVKEVTTTN